MTALICFLVFLHVAADSAAWASGAQSGVAISSRAPVRSKQISLLAAELKEMAAADQAVRFEHPPVKSRIRAVDKKHYPRLLQIYRTYGWPAISLFGKEAGDNYWLLVQHQDLAFQKMVFPAMKRAMAKGEASKMDYAYLYDRVMVRQGKPQHWGTQGRCLHGNGVLYDVDERATLDRRRAELNLWPEKEYLRMLCHPPASPKVP